MIFDELRPHADAPERKALDEMAAILKQERPVPRAGFRAELRAHLTELERARPAVWRPQRLGAMVAAYAGSGVGLLLLAALGLGGSGPLG